MKRSYLVILTSVILFGLFVLLSKYEDRSQLRQLDFAVTVKVQERIDRSSHLRLKTLVDNSMEGATFFASPEFSSLVVLIISGYVFYDRKKRKIRWKALAVPLLFLLIVAIELYGKSVVHHPSPSFAMIKHPTSMFPATYVNEQFSYPSGHAARAIFLVFVFFSTLYYSFRGKTARFSFSMTLLGYVLLVGVSRIYLGHHWFSDVVGGALLGGSMGMWMLLM